MFCVDGRRQTKNPTATLGMLLCAAISAAALTACSSTSPAGESAAPGNGHADSVLLPGKCRFLSAADVARATGLRTIKPVETEGGCSYLFDANAVIPSLDPAVDPAKLDESLPPSIDFYFWSDSVAINGVTTDLASGTFTKVPGVGKDAGWSDKNQELAVVLQNGVVRIEVTAPKQPQRFRTGDLRAIAVQLFKAAEPRLRYY